MLMSPVGLRYEKGCAGDARQYRPVFSSERAPHVNKPESVKKKIGNVKNWSRVSGGCLTTRRTSRQTAGRNVTLTFVCHNYHSSPITGREFLQWETAMSSSTALVSQSRGFHTPNYFHTEDHLHTAVNVSDFLVNKYSWLGQEGVKIFAEFTNT
jgi:hypothetical protein